MAKKTKITETFTPQLTPKDNRRFGAAKPENTCPINLTEQKPAQQEDQSKKGIPREKERVSEEKIETSKA